MTAIACSVLPFLMLIMGVVTFDHWGNVVNMGDDRSEEIGETKLFPVRHIRPDSAGSCTCESVMKRHQFGEGHYPRYLSSNKCIEEHCVNDGICKEVDYYVNVSSFRNIYPRRFPLSRQTFCPEGEWETVSKKISAACVRIVDTCQRK